MDPQPAGISREELQLAARNHGMPLEALRHEITPVGLHYLLVHYDIPAVGAEWRLRVDGRVRHPLELDLDSIRARPSVTQPVTMECAGNGRVSMEPHVTSQPWILEAVGTGEWTARRWRPCWSRPACRTTPSRSCSRASIAAWRAATSRRTGAASRSSRRSRTARSWPTS